MNKDIALLVDRDQSRAGTPNWSKTPPHPQSFVLLGLLLYWAGSVVAVDFSELDREARLGELGNLKALLIARDGQLLFEGYYRGTDRETLHAINSVTKSLGATLLGVLHRQRRLALDEPVRNSLRGYAWNSDPRLQANRSLTIEQVLTQQHGLDWEELTGSYQDPNNPLNRMIASPDWYYFVLSRDRVAEPGTVFEYSTGVSTLMSAVVRAKTGLSPQAFAQQALLTPLGIDRVAQEMLSDQGLGHGSTNWPYGDAPLGFAWWLRARDMLKLGELYRSGGEYQGQRLLDRDWVRRAWTRHGYSDDVDLHYGYQWWLSSYRDDRGREHPFAYAVGYGRQYVFVFPDLGLTVVSAADDYQYSGRSVKDALREYLLGQFDYRLDSRFSGGWYDPALDGQGLQIEVSPSGRVTAYWFTFDATGRQQWLVGEGHAEGEWANLRLYRPEGGRFLAPGSTTVAEVGQAILRFSDCDRGTLAFTLDGEAGSYGLQRLTGRCRSDLLPLDGRVDVPLQGKVERPATTARSP